MYQDFPFTIEEVVDLLRLTVRRRNAISLDANCPFCGGKGKLNVNFPKNVFKCNRCGESGGMLALYGKVYGMDTQAAYGEITEALGRNEKAPACEVKQREVKGKDPEIITLPHASLDACHKTYSKLLEFLTLSDHHREALLKRGFTQDQIEANGYRSTPVFGLKRLCRRLLEAGCVLKGVPGFYVDEEDGVWTMCFKQRTTGFLIPVRNLDGMILGMQIRVDHLFGGGKYVWFSSTNYFKGASSGSPVHLAGEPGAKVLFITEGPLKGDLAHAVSGRTFGCVAGVNQYGNLPAFLSEMKDCGTESIYEAYDMDKLTRTVCRGDYGEKCASCPHYLKWQEREIVCEKKVIKRNNIQRGCNNLAAACEGLGLTYKRLVWDMDENGEWAERVKGVDDYLVGLERKKEI